MPERFVETVQRHQVDLCERDSCNNVHPQRENDARYGERAPGQGGVAKFGIPPARFVHESVCGDLRERFANEPRLAGRSELRGL